MNKPLSIVTLLSLLSVSVPAQVTCTDIFASASGAEPSGQVSMVQELARLRVRIEIAEASQQTSLAASYKSDFRRKRNEMIALHVPFENFEHYLLQEKARSTKSVEVTKQQAQQIAQQESIYRPWEKSQALNSGYLSSARFSPDGARVITSGPKNVATVWDSDTGQKIQELAGHLNRVNGASFSPDGQFILTSSQDESSKIWDARNFSEIKTLSDSSGAIITHQWSSDSRQILTKSELGHVILWDLGTGQILQRWKMDVSSGASIAQLSPDQKWVALAFKKMIQLRDATSGALVRTFEMDKAVSAVAFSPDSKKLATASSRGVLAFWDPNSDSPLALLKDHKNSIRSIVFSPDGKRLVSVSEDRTAVLWDADSGKPFRYLRGHRDFVYKAAFRADGRLLMTVSRDESVKAWDPRTGDHLEPLGLPENSAKSLSFSVDGRMILTTSIDGTAQLWRQGFGN